jgi:hypothetical protein
MVTDEFVFMENRWTELARALLSAWPTQNETLLGKGRATVSQRQSDLLHLRDTLEHLHLCQQQLTLTDEPDAIEYLTDTMLHGLDQCRRLCRNIHQLQTLPDLRPVC